ncbi:hypothetical protein EAH89_24290 [Roseomonas nepalensis]|uniref:Uncharacterized protein n=1 Tax=Muricoccus nepalensis TaxID=1854500 RepID=A0A502FC98_9PROT|nr:hypothetical protein [Roseomonas nepalensis]TPG46923.1 hypothetical protein EAH89_24290 [Roseomonas nepalensis]
MEIRYGTDGKGYVLRYQPGDLVRLRVNESGDGAMGRAGQWGSVITVGDGGTSLDIQLAGYSEGKNSPLQRLIGIPRSIVVPCKPDGSPMELPSGRARRGDGASALEANQNVVVNTTVALPAWAAALVVASCTLILVVAAAIAAKNFGPF